MADVCYAVAKRGLDVMIGSSLLLILSPVLITIALAIRVESRGPVVFTQQRHGLGGRLFRMYKFRTMRIDLDDVPDKDSHQAPTLQHGCGSPTNDGRVTPLGTWLRRTSLDEVPNLVNVLRGDMSLVGPRPTRYSAEAYGELRDVILSVRPGVTGLWQVMGRKDLGWDRRVRLDYEYVRRRSVGLDLYILAKTIPAVLKGNGAW